MDIEDHIQQEYEPTLQERIADLMMFEDFDSIGTLLTDTLADFFDFFRNDSLLYRMLNLANHIRVSHDVRNVSFDLKRKRVTISPNMAVLIESGHDLAFLFLVERSRLIVNKQAHTVLQDGMDLTNKKHHVVFDLARSCYCNALARCYCASTLAERRYASSMDFMSMLQHGLMPDQFCDVLRECNMPNVASAYMRLYQMAGQEQYHAMLNRMPVCHGTLHFSTVIEKFWEDFKPIIEEYEAEQEKRKQKREESEANVEDRVPDDADDADYMICVTESGEDEQPKNIEQMCKAASRTDNDLEVYKVEDIDADSEIDSYIAEVIIASNLNERSGGWYGNQMSIPDVGKVRDAFQPLTHSALMQVDSEEDAFRYGTIVVPHRPSTRDLAMHLQGHTPMLWETQMLPQHDSRNTSAYALYVDVSGSQYAWIPYVRALARQFGVFTHPDHVYVFSDKVAPLETKAPFVLTTGGTHIKSVFDHAKQHRLANILLVTDLADYTKVGNGDGLDHVICIVTDKREAPKKEDTVLSTLSNKTKLDMFPIMLDQLRKRKPDGDSRTHFSEV